MSDINRKHIIVDGVDFRSLFLFPRILEAVWQALQPARLLIGLLMVLAIITFGEGWDKLTAPVSPNGLRSGELISADQVRWESAARFALQQFATAEDAAALIERMDRSNANADDNDDENDDDHAGADDPHPLDIMHAVATGYRASRTTLVENSDGLDDEAASARLERADAAFLRSYAELDNRRPRGLWEATRDHISHGFARIFRGTLRFDLPEVGGGLAQTFFDTPIHLWRAHPLFLITLGLFLLLTFATGGTAIARMTAVQIAQRERLPLTQALGFAVSSFHRALLGMLLPLILAALVIGFLLIGGLLLAVPWLNILAALFYGLSLLLGLLAAFLIILWALSLFFIAPAVACENADAGDAMQKAFAYTILRPFRLIWYIVIALLGLAVGYAVVAFFGWAVISLTASAAGAGAPWHGAAPIHPFLLAGAEGPAHLIHFETAADLRVAHYLINLWEMIVRGLVVGYILVYIFTAATIIYMLIRHAIDRLDPEQIWLPGLQPGTLSTIPRKRTEGE